MQQGSLLLLLALAEIASTKFVGCLAHGINSEKFQASLARLYRLDIRLFRRVGHFSALVNFFGLVEVLAQEKGQWSRPESCKIWKISVASLHGIRQLLFCF
jgi:hypothetical protein